MTFLDMWVTGNGNNSVDYSNPEYDKLIAEAGSTNDLELRQKNFLACEKLIADECPATVWTASKRRHTVLYFQGILSLWWRKRIFFCQFLKLENAVCQGRLLGNSLGMGGVVLAHFLIDRRLAQRFFESFVQGGRKL